MSLDIVAETAAGLPKPGAVTLNVLALDIEQDTAVWGTRLPCSAARVRELRIASDFAASDGRYVANQVDRPGSSKDDSAVEGDESLSIQLLANAFPPAAKVVNGDGTNCAGTCRSTVTIIDDESPPAKVTGVKLSPGTGSLTVDWTAVAWRHRLQGAVEVRD